MKSKEKEDIVPLIDVLHKTHKRADGTFVDNRAKITNGEFQKKLSKHLADHQAVQAYGSVKSNYTPTIDKLYELFLEVTHLFSFNFYYYVIHTKLLFGR